MSTCNIRSESTPIRSNYDIAFAEFDSCKNKKEAKQMIPNLNNNCYYHNKQPNNLGRAWYKNTDIINTGNPFNFPGYINPGYPTNGFPAGVIDYTPSYSCCGKNVKVDSNTNYSTSKQIYDIKQKFQEVNDLEGV